MSLNVCPLCNETLPNNDNVTRWVHDIINHEEYWKAQNYDATKNQLQNAIIQIVRYYLKGKDKSK